MFPWLQPHEFAARLHAKLLERGWSQAQLAREMGMSKAAVTGWLRYGVLPDAAVLAAMCRVLECSADELLGLANPTERQTADGAVRWTEQLPASIPETLQDSLREGARLFGALLSGDATGLPGAQTTRALVQAALRAGAVQLTRVARDEVLEREVAARYPSLKRVVVGRVPDGCEHPIVRTELTAFLAARAILSQLVRPRTFGLGSGYTMLRVCENSIPTADQFNGTAWVPLVAFRHEQGADYTANYLAKFMSIRHANSRALVLPHPDHAGSSLYAAQLDEANRAMRDLHAVMVSVGGVDARQGAAELLSTFRSADFAADAADLRSRYAAIEPPDAVGAEVLRCLIDRQGRIIARDSETGNQPDLSVLRYASVMGGTVCIVASGAHKASATRLCAHIGLANALVIDTEIARAIL